MRRSTSRPTYKYKQFNYFGDLLIQIPSYTKKIQGVVRKYIYSHRMWIGRLGMFWWCEWGGLLYSVCQPSRERTKLWCSHSPFLILHKKKRYELIDVDYLFPSIIDLQPPNKTLKSIIKLTPCYFNLDRVWFVPLNIINALFRYKLNIVVCTL